MLRPAAELAVALVMVRERLTLLEALRTLDSHGGEAKGFCDVAMAALLRLELDQMGSISDLTAFDGAPREWTWLRWRVGAEGLAVASRGHALRARRLRPEPRMAHIQNMLSPSECAHIIELGKSGGELHPSRVVNHDVGGSTGIRTHARTSESCRVSAGQDRVVMRVVQRAAYLTGLSAQHSEAVQVVHYEPGQQYRPHYDYFTPDDARFRAKTAVQGNRLVSVFVYLSGCPAGGRTYFPNLRVGFTPEVGSAVLWYNLDRHGNLDERTLHAGEPVEEGEKWGLNVWLRERPRHVAIKRRKDGLCRATLLVLPCISQGGEGEGEGGSEGDSSLRALVRLKLNVSKPPLPLGMAPCVFCGDVVGPIALCLCKARYELPP